MRSVFNKSEYRRLKHRPVKIIQLLMDDIKCCTERITKGYCSKDVDNIDIWFLNIIPDMLQSLMDKKMGVPKEIYDNYENIENGSDEKVRTYQNGSTSEIVYADTDCTKRIGSLDPRERCDCFGTFYDKAMVRYKVNGTNNYKIGFCKWLGGVK